MTTGSPSNPLRSSSVYPRTHSQIIWSSNCGTWIYLVGRTAGAPPTQQHREEARRGTNRSRGSVLPPAPIAHNAEH